jgi:hypothetical protein
LAGVVGLLTFILALYVCLAIAGLLFNLIDQVAGARATGVELGGGSAGQVIVSILAGSARNALRGLWGARAGFLVYGLLGVLAALADWLGASLAGGRPGLASLVCIAVVILVTFITWSIVQGEEVDVFLSRTPDQVWARGVMRATVGTKVAVSLVLGLLAVYPIWAVWRWWYLRLGRLVRAPAGDAGAASSAEGVPSGVETLTILREGLRRGAQPVLWLAIPFVVCVALLFPVRRYHDGLAMEIQHGTAYPAVGSLTPSQMLPVTVKATDDSLRIVNINGLGTVGIHLSPTDDPQDAVRSYEDWTFEWRLDEYLYVDFPMDGVAPGDYMLHFVMAEGWGYFEFTLAHGGGTASHLSALVYGVLMACAVLLGAALVALAAVRVRGALEATGRL